jgi:uncharacterized protein
MPSFPLGPVRVSALRLGPGDDLRKEIEAAVSQLNLTAGFVVSVVGSLSVVCLRYAGKSDASEVHGDLEMLSLGGTLTVEGGVHLHLTVSNGEGRCIGGHLLEGSIVRTTAEIVLGEAEALCFTRVDDPETGYKELQIRSRREP